MVLRDNKLLTKVPMDIDILEEENILTAWQTPVRVLGLMAYWYTGSAFHQIPHAYLSEL